MIWQFLGPGSGWAYAEGQRGLSPEQEDAIYFGSVLDDPLPDVAVTHLSDGRLGNLIGSSFSAFIVSTGVQAALHGRAPVQLVPVVFPQGAADGYAILNVLAHVPCFDFERSDYDRMPGHPDRLLAVRRLALCDIPYTAPAIFRIAGLPGALLVRDALRSELERLDNGTGEFVRVEDYAWGLV